MCWTDAHGAPHTNHSRRRKPDLVFTDANPRRVPSERAAQNALEKLTAWTWTIPSDLNMLPSNITHELLAYGHFEKFTTEDTEFRAKRQSATRSFKPENGSSTFSMQGSREGFFIWQP
jgi:hypothetical protein